MRWLLTLFATLALASPALAQEGPAPAPSPAPRASAESPTAAPPDAPKATTPTASSQGAPTFPFPDPTAPSGRFARDRGRLPGSRSVSATRLPQVKLRGRILLSNKAAAALIEVDNELLLVKVGSEVTIDAPATVVTSPPATGRDAGASMRQPVLRTLVLKVTKLDATDIQFEVLATKQKLVVR